jgi:hypothetical protein
MPTHHNSLQQLQQVIHSLTVDMIAENLVSVDSSDDASRARAIMQERRFDVLGVTDGNKKVIGYIKKDEPRPGKVKEFRSDINVDEIVSYNACLEDCLMDIYTKGRMFVLSGEGIKRIVTVADLQKIPVRLMIFGVLSLLEMNLLEWISKKYPRGEWMKMLSPTRLRKAEKLYEERQRKNQEIDLVDCLQLCDKADILIKADNNILSSLGFHSKNDARDFFEQLQTLRNYLAHAQDLTEEMEWSQIAELTNRAKGIIQQIMFVLNDNDKSSKKIS